MDGTIYEIAKDVLELKATAQKVEQMIKTLADAHNKLVEDKNAIGKGVVEMNKVVMRLRADVDNLMKPKEEPKSKSGEERLKKQFKANTDQI